jgi:hypothetical protein
MEKVNNQDDIDLLSLFLKTINIIRSNFWIILTFFLIGSFLGVSYYYLTNKIYQSSLVISSGILTKSYAETLVENINRQRRESNIKAIENSLNVSEQTAKALSKLRIQSVSEVEDLKESDKFIITAEVLNPDIFGELQRGLIHYFENNQFVKVRVEQNKNFLKQMLAKIDEEIKDMEAFKDQIITGSFFRNAQGNVMFDPTTVNTKILELTKERLTLQNNLELVNSVQVIEGFTKYERPVRPRLSVSLISGSFVGLVFVSILIAFKSIRKILRMADSAKQKA